MAISPELEDWVVEAIRAHGGTASVVEVARHIWEHHEDDLRDAGDLFYTWQYKMRWSALVLRHKEVLQPADVSPRGIWELQTQKS